MVCLQMRSSLESKSLHQVIKMKFFWILMSMITSIISYFTQMLRMNNSSQFFAQRVGFKSITFGSSVKHVLVRFDHILRQQLPYIDSDYSSFTSLGRVWNDPSNASPIYDLQSYGDHKQIVSFRRRCGFITLGILLGFRVIPFCLLHIFLNTCLNLFLDRHCHQAHCCVIVSFEEAQFNVYLGTEANGVFHHR